MKKICLLLSAAVFCCVADVKAGSETNVVGGNFFSCGRCFKFEISKKVPLGGKCARKGKHSWKMLAAVGDNYYGCKKCFVILPTKGKPQTTVCPAGSTHQWENIGKMGNVTQLKCSKCQVSLSFAKAPKNPGTCKKGGQHDWMPAKAK